MLPSIKIERTYHDATAATIAEARVSTRSVQQLLDGLFDLVVLTLAVVLKYDLAPLIDDVLRRPISIAVRCPGLQTRHRRPINPRYLA